MKDVKSKSELEQWLNALSKYDKNIVKGLVYAFTETQDYDILYALDEKFIYPNRWDVFEHGSDTELIYEMDDVEDLVEVLYGLFGYANGRADD